MANPARRPGRTASAAGAAAIVAAALSVALAACGGTTGGSAPAHDALAFLSPAPGSTITSPGRHQISVAIDRTAIDPSTLRVDVTGTWADHYAECRGEDLVVNGAASGYGEDYRLDGTTMSVTAALSTDVPGPGELCVSARKVSGGYVAARIPITIVSSLPTMTPVMTPAVTSFATPTATVTP